MTGTNRFFDIVKSRQQKESGTTSTTPSPPNSTPAATSNTSSSTGTAKPKQQAKAKKRTLAFATPSPVPKKSPKPKQTASPELLAKWLRQFPWLRFDEQRGLYCFFCFKHRDNVLVWGTGRAINVLSIGTDHCKIDVLKDHGSRYFHLAPVLQVLVRAQVQALHILLSVQTVIQRAAPTLPVKPRNAPQVLQHHWRKLNNSPCHSHHLTHVKDPRLQPQHQWTICGIGFGHLLLIQSKNTVTG